MSARTAPLAAVEAGVHPAFDAEAQAPIADARFRRPRMLFYLGCALTAVLVLRPVLGLTAGDLVFFAALVVAVPEAMVRRHSIRGPGIVLPCAVALYAAGAILSGARNDGVADAVSVVSRLFYMGIVWTWCALLVLRTTEQIRVATACWIVSLTASSAVAVLQLLYPEILPGAEIYVGRMTGFCAHPNDLGASVAVGIVPAIARAVEGPRRLPFAACALLMVAGIMLSGSVGALIAAGAAVLFWLGLQGLVRPRVVVAAALVFGSAIAFATIQESHEGRSPLARLDTEVFSGDSHGTYGKRIETVEEAWARIERDPWIGEGPRPEGVVLSSGSVVHNSLLQAWYEAGVLGALGMVVLYAAGYLYALRSLERSRTRYDRATVGPLVAASLASAIGSLGAPMLVQRYAWMPLVLLVTASVRLRGAAPAAIAQSIVRGRGVAR